MYPKPKNLRKNIFIVFFPVLACWTIIGAATVFLQHYPAFSALSAQEFVPQLFGVWLDFLPWIFGLLGIAYGVFRFYHYLIADQKNVESLQESEERFRQLVELSPNGIAVHQDGRVVFINRSVLELLRASDEKELLGRAVIDFVHPDSRPIVLERIGEMARTGQPAPRMQEKFLRLDGSTIDVEVTSAPLQFRSRAAFQVIIEDITYRKRLERAIQSIEKGVSTAIGQAFFESAVFQLAQALESDVVLIGEYLPKTGAVRTISAISDGVPIPNFEYSLAGAPCSNVMNQSICCYASGVAGLFPEDAALVEMQVEGYLGMPLWDSKHNPTGIIVCLYHKPIADPDYAKALIQIFASRVEVEIERNRILNDLQESRALLATVFNNIPFEIWVTDAQGACILQNPVSQRYWGNTVGKLPKDLDRITEKTQIDWREKNLRALQGESVSEFKTAEINGQTYYLESSMSPIYVDGRVNGLVGVNIDITVRKRAEEKLKQSFDRLSALREIDQIILGGNDIRLVISGIAHYAVSLLHADAVEILLYDPATQTLEILSRQGVGSYASFKHFPVSGDIASRAVLQHETIFERNFAEYLKDYPECQELAAEDFCTYIALPLIGKGTVRGVLEVFQHTDLAPDNQWWELAQTLTAQAAIAIDNMLLFQGLQRSNAELSLAYDLTLEGWSNALELRDRETEGHSQRVATLTIRLAEAMNVPHSQLVHIRRGALLHDIGKMGIPDDILHKPGPLTADEWAIVKRHPQTAFELLLPIPFLRQALDIPYSHHERWDGSGYPRALKGLSIPLAARIFSVVDVWDALTSDRPYHSAETTEKAIQYLQEQSGKLFDPEIVRAFEKIIKK